MAIAPKIFRAQIDTRTGESRAVEFQRLSEEQRKEKFSTLTEEEQKTLRYSWKFWARPNQLIPPGKWETWVCKAGRGWGKTRVGAETLRIWARDTALTSIIAPTASDVRDVCVEGESGVLAICPDNERPDYQPSHRRLEWPSGARTMLFSADEPERLRGPQHMKVWCDELAAWRYLDDAWSNMQFGLRLGTNPQALVTTTPKPVKILKELLADPATFITNGTTYENRANLAEKFYNEIIKKHEGTRLGRQEIHAEMLDDNPGAMWRLSWFDETRVSPDLFWAEMFPKLLRVVGAIDPAVTSTEESDETGIGFMGVMTFENAKKCLPPALLDLCKDEAGQYKQFEHFFFFDDRSDKYSPDGWGKAACAGYHQFKADRIIGEKNNGGDMVESTLRNVDPNVSYKGVHASRGKQTRAQPIAALYEQKRVHHVGTFGTLEDQCCDYDPLTAQYSPDRMDMLVWGMTELSESSMVLGLLDYEQSGKAAKTMDDMAKVQSATSLAKPATNDQTPKCPNCGCLVIQKIPGNQARCMQCAKQWALGEQPKAEPPSRSTYLETH